MEWETVKVEGTGHIVELVLNRPQIHNAVNAQLLRDVAAACTAINELDDCRAVIVRGEGKSFSSGADLKEQGALRAELKARQHRAKLGANAVNAISDLYPVTIAAVQGHAIGGGACLAMACDFQIGSEHCSVSIREAALGLSLSWNSIPNTVQLVGPKRAKQMILLAKAYDAATLLDWGFFDEVVPEAELLPAARRMAQAYADMPPLPVHMGKASINAYVKLFNRSVFHMDEVGVTYSGNTDDAKLAAEVFFSGEQATWHYK